MPLSERDRNSLLETSAPESGVQMRFARRILFIPWGSGKSDQYDNADTWVRVAQSGNNPKQKSFERVPYNGGRVDPLLKTLRENDVVYILGHCSPGSAELFAYQDEKRGIDAEEVALRMIATGLPYSWTGDLKVYACYSASASQGSESFLNQLAKFLRSKEFKCRIWGYTEAVSSYPVHNLLASSSAENVVAIVDIGGRHVVLPDGKYSNLRAHTAREPSAKRFNVGQSN